MAIPSGTGTSTSTTSPTTASPTTDVSPEIAADQAQQFAEAAIQRAELARQQAAEAARAAQRAAERAAAARSRLNELQRDLRRSTGPTRDDLQEQVSQQRQVVREADQTLERANLSLQKLEERVVKAGRAAENAMHASNAAAKRAGIGSPLNPVEFLQRRYQQNEIESAGVQVEELRDAFDGAGPRRAKLEQTLGIKSSTDLEDLEASLQADRQLRSLIAKPETQQLLQELDIDSAADLADFGAHLIRLTEGGEPGEADFDLRGVSDPAALAGIIAAAVSTQESPAAARFEDENFVALVARGKDPGKITDTDVAIEAYRSATSELAKKPLEKWTQEDAADFTDALADTIETYGDSPEMVKMLLTLAGSQLERSTEILAKAGEDDGSDEDAVEALAANFSRIGNAAPPDVAAKLAYVVAQGWDDDSNLHQVDDGFQKYIDRGGSPQFRDLVAAALVHDGKETAAEELLIDHGKSGGDRNFFQKVGDTAGDVFGNVGDFLEDRLEDVKKVVGNLGDVFTDVASEVKDAAEKAFQFVTDEVINELGDKIREAAVSLLDLDGQIAKLNSPGDTFVASLDLEVGFLEFQAGAGAELKITRTEDGYQMALTGENSGGIAAKLNIPGLSKVKLEADTSRSATLKFDFDDVAEVTHAAETIAGVAMGVGLAASPAAPLGVAMIASAIDDLGDISDNYAGVTLQYGTQGSLGGELGEKLLEKLHLPGGKVSANTGYSFAIDWPADGPPSLVLSQSIGVDGELSLAGEIPLPDGGKLNPGSVHGSASLELETRIPLDLDFEELIDDPLGAIEDMGQEAIDGATTTISGNLEFGAKVGVKGKSLKLGADESLQISLSATAHTKDMAKALRMALTGDLAGALGSLSNDVTVEGEIRAFSEESAGIGSNTEAVDGDKNRETQGEGVSVPGIGSAELTAAYASRDSRVLVELEGTPNEILTDFGSVIDLVAFNESGDGSGGGGGSA